MARDVGLYALLCSRELRCIYIQLSAFVKDLFFVKVPILDASGSASEALHPMILPHELVSCVVKRGHGQKILGSTEAVSEFWHHHRTCQTEWCGISGDTNPSPLGLWGDEARVTVCDKLYVVSFNALLDGRAAAQDSKGTLDTRFPVSVFRSDHVIRGQTMEPVRGSCLMQVIMIVCFTW